MYAPFLSCRHSDGSPPISSPFAMESYLPRLAKYAFSILFPQG